MYYNLLEGRPKSDIVFFEAFKQQRSNRRWFSLLKAILFVEMALLIILNYTYSVAQVNDVIQALIINALVSLFGMWLQIAQLSNVYTNPQAFLNLAESSLHVVANQFTSNVGSVEDCVSQTVFVGIGNITINDLNDQVKRTYIAATLKALGIQFSAKYKGYATLSRFHSSLSMVSLINSIIVLIQQPNLDSMNQGFIIFYIIIVGLSQIFIIIVLILISLIPLAVCVFCFYACCCKKSRGSTINLPMKNATMQDIVNCDGTCSICYQNIGQNEQIYVLTCSDKHVYHKDCLNHWSRVKNTCPICRTEIPMGNGPSDLLNDQ